MATWTPERKTMVVDKYLAGEPTPASSIELIKEIAEEMEESPNSIRAVLVQAKVYVKKAESTATTTTTKDKPDTGTKRVSKESQLDALKSAIENAGGTVDEEILSKLTGKAAAYFTALFSAAK